ncbi:MAG: hypothetical protein Q8R55_07150 [Candidatus Taylorbacteria bacterium]|nr:hypothetical protein [Candidatus Taylorbacteria bacterium]
MVKLFVESTNLHSPVAAVRWCVDKNTINKLKEWGVSKPFMLFVVARENDGEFREVDQKVVPLDQAMEYIDFHSPGKHRIFGCLVWGSRTKQVLARYFRSYHNHNGVLVDSEGNFHQPSSYSHSDLDYGSVDVVVPDGYFAKEPAAWEKWWVNLWYESKPVNQCHFRRRRLLAYSIQPLVVLGYVLCRTSLSLAHLIVLLLIGTRKIQYQAILHPFIYDRWDAAPDKLSSVFLENSSGVERHPVYFLSIPLVQLVILGLLGLINWGLHWLGLSLGSVLLWLLAINVVVILAAIIVSMLGGWDKLFPEETEEQKTARRKLEMERLYAEYQDMVCSGVALQPSVSALPSQRRTFYLRFMEFKSKVCLPFAH